MDTINLFTFAPIGLLVKVLVLLREDNCKCNISGPPVANDSFFVMSRGGAFLHGVIVMTAPMKLPHAFRLQSTEFMF